MSRRGENIYKRKDGRWEGRVLIEKGKYIHFYGKSYTEVKKKKMIVLKKDNLNDPCSSVITCASKSLQLWLKDCRGRIKMSTFENYYYCVSSFMIPFFKNAAEDEFSQKNVGDFNNCICNNKGLSSSYQRKILTIFKVAVRAIFKDTNVAAMLLHSIKPPKAQAGFVQAFSIKEQNQIERVLLKCKDNKAIGLMLCFYTGMRLGELGALKWENIDLCSNTLEINGTLVRVKSFKEIKKTNLIISSTKNKTSTRRIPLPEFLCELIKDQKEQADQKHYILSEQEAPLDPRSYQRYYKKILSQAGVEYRKFHTIRHTFATRALEMGVDIKTLSELLGHANVIHTLNIYAHSLMEQKKNAIAKLNSMHRMNMIS